MVILAIFNGTSGLFGGVGLRPRLVDTVLVRGFCTVLVSGFCTVLVRGFFMIGAGTLIGSGEDDEGFLSLSDLEPFFKRTSFEGTTFEDFCRILEPLLGSDVVELDVTGHVPGEAIGIADILVLATSVQTRVLIEMLTGRD